MYHNNINDIFFTITPSIVFFILPSNKINIHEHSFLFLTTLITFT